MSRLKNLSIRARLTLLTVMSVSMALVVACVIFVCVDIRWICLSKVTQLQAITEMIGTNSTAAVAFSQNDAADDLLRSLSSRPLIVDACILTVEGDVFAEYSRDGQAVVAGSSDHFPGYRYTDEGQLQVTSPIIDDGELLGFIRVRESTIDLERSISSNAIVALVVLLVSIVIGVGASIPLMRSISKPILELTSTVKKISEQEDYAVRVPEHGDGEIGVLFQQFNQLLECIQSREAAVNEASDQLRVMNEQLESRVLARTEELEEANTALQLQMQEKDDATEELQRTHQQLIDASRRAGMADIANGVLHNVGNVLNSLNISAQVINDGVRDLKVDGLARCVDLIRSNQDDIGHFFVETQQGKMIPQYLAKLSESLSSGRDGLLNEIVSLSSNVEHIKDVVRAQQSHAGSFGVSEDAAPTDLFTEAKKFVSDSISRHHVELVEEFDETTGIRVERAKVVQILVNLIKNAKESVLEYAPSPKRVVLRIRERDCDVLMEVVDTGMGISQPNLTKIFSHGFTTKEGGHGFGLHASANAAAEMGGRLSAKSDGHGQGATFTLRLPKATAESRSERALMTLPASSESTIAIDAVVR